MGGPREADDDRWRQLEVVLAKQEIRDVLARFCRGVDRGEIELVRSCFHPDARDDHGAYRGGIDGLCEAVEGMVERTAATHHLLGQALIEIDGDRATSECYVLAYHRTRARPGSAEFEVLVGARYLDLFERREGQWRIWRRTVSHAWSRRCEAADRWRGADAFAQDSRGPEDLSYQLDSAWAIAPPAT